MGAFRDLAGQQFGRLTVIGVTGKTDGGNYTWSVECSCGKLKTLPSDHLVRRVAPVTSCGCYRDDRIREVCSPSPNATAFNLLIGAYRKRARRKNIEFSLSVAEFRAFVESHCHYCDTPPTQTMFNRPKTGVFTYNGIDKIDPSGGYIAGNCLPCCKACNYMKGSLSYSEFQMQVAAIHGNWVAKWKS